MTPKTTDSPEPFWNLETRLASALLILAGFIGAAAYTHSQGYFVTFMTGNSERAVLGGFLGDRELALGAAGLIVCFLAGVVVASICRRYWWRNHPHGATMLTTLALSIAAAVDALLYWHDRDLGLTPILFVAFGMGSLNTSFVKNGETAIPVTYVTGTLVKLAQGIERHMAGGTHRDWLGYAVQWCSFVLGGFIGGLVSLVVDGRDMLFAAVVGSTIVSVYTWLADLRWVRCQERETQQV
ncbi:YoaK family protein [Nocardia sp. CDC159]|uniref:YoaK family protein n=1 Tax=Nocardia pulmonis TaxID=2951408 RepID=A0A9X2E817_9NOCA|nr:MULTISPECIES: YoaK family protein [Nocardia]MCM6775280.1 YoaK family protein [Nocardia pulmonis]MCM6787986.1 YoaK family protein [Nocardia sp. CDC159]